MLIVRPSAVLQLIFVCKIRQIINNVQTKIVIVINNSVLLTKLLSNLADTGDVIIYHIAILDFQ